MRRSMDGRNAPRAMRTCCARIATCRSAACTAARCASNSCGSTLGRASAESQTLFREESLGLLHGGGSDRLQLLREPGAVVRVPHLELDLGELLAQPEPGRLLELLRDV